MIKSILQNINQLYTTKVKYKVKVYFLQPELFTEDDKLISVSNLVSSLSVEGAYEISNSTILLSNKSFYFCNRLYYEIILGKSCRVLIEFVNEDIDFMMAKIRDWKLSSTILELKINI